MNQRQTDHRTIQTNNRGWTRRLLPWGTIGVVCALVALLSWSVQRSQALVATCTVPSAGYGTIQAAVDDPTCTTIEIAPGTYTEAVEIKRSLTLRGAGNEQTILDGETVRRPLTLGLTDAETIDTTLEIMHRIYIEDLAVRNGNATTIAPTIPPVNTGRIGGGILVRNLTAAHLRDLRVYDNIARAGGTGSGFGGGIGAYGRSEVHVSNGTRIYGNQAATNSGSGFGGGIATLDSTLYLTDTYVYENVAKNNIGGQGKGGGIYVDDFALDNISPQPLAHLTIRNSQIENNTAIGRGGAGYGGGLFAGETTDTRVWLYGNTWNGNVARGSEAGSGDGYGGALATDVQMTGTAYVAIDGDTFTANVANAATIGSTDNAHGGALYFDANSTDLLTGTVTNATFTGNDAFAGTGNPTPQGGALWSRFVRVTLTEVAMQNNGAAASSVSGQGGAMRMNGAPLLVYRSTFFDNSANQGGALYMRNDDSNRVGYLRVINSIWADNSATQGAQIYHANANSGDTSYLYHTTLANEIRNPAQALYVESAPLTVRNSIISDHATGIANGGGIALVADYNLFFNNTNDTSGSVGPGTNSQTGEPAYVNPVARDYHIGATSAARDQGINDVNVTNDIDNDVRDANPDFGADEYVTTPPTATPTATGTATPTPTPTTENTATTTPTSSSTPTAAATNTPTVTPTKTPIVIEVRNNVFSPASITITVGDTVIWRRIEGFHNVRADDDSFRLGEPDGSPGSSWTEVSYTFTEIGTVAYYCEQHGAPNGVSMAGEVIVQAAATSTATPTVTETGTTTPTPSTTTTPTTSPTATATPTRTPIIIDVTNNSFSPASVTVQVGDTVIWRRLEGFHNVRTDDGLFRLGDENGDVSNTWTEVSYTFLETGTIGYYCEAHGGPNGVGMAGEIIVQAAPTSTPTNTPGVTPSPSSTSSGSATVTPTVTGTTTPSSGTGTPTVTPTASGTPSTSESNYTYLPIVQQGSGNSSSPTVTILDIGISGSNYVVAFSTSGFTPAFPGTHMHFYFNTVPATEAGLPGSGPWYLNGAGSPFAGVPINERPTAATQLCVLVANNDHTVQQGTGNCYPLP